MVKIFKRLRPRSAAQARRIANILVIIMITVTATAYDAPCNICRTRARTESGRSVKLPGVASGRWPQGTVLSIQGIGRRVVDDRCRGALDIRFTGKNAHARAKKFGRKKLKVKVIKNVKKVHMQGGLENRCGFSGEICA